MLRWILNLSFFACLVAVFEWLIAKFARLAFKLADNAVMGWGDEVIGRWLGLTSPTEVQVLGFLLEWGPPVFLAAAALWGWDQVVQRRHRAAETLAPADAPPRHTKVSAPSPEGYWVDRRASEWRERPERFTHLADAARRVFEAMQEAKGNKLEAIERIAADKFRGSILIACADRILTNGPAVYGERVPSSKREILPPDAAFGVGAGELSFSASVDSLVTRNGRPVWANLMVREDELTAHIATVGAAALAPPVPSLVFVSASDLLARAAALGWVFSDPSLHVLDLQDGLREAAVHNRVSVFGRKKRSARILTEGEPRVAIPADYWTEGWIQIMAALPLGGGVFSGSNFNTEAYRPTVAADYVDLHFGPNVMSWLEHEAVQYRGRRTK